MKYYFTAETVAGTKFETVIDENNESTATAQAKIEVERWLADEGEPAEGLIEFNLVGTRR